ncbi:DNA polymerase III subunit beta [Erythrobacter sp. HA6-11]
MSITIEAGVLARMMRVAGQVVAKRNTIPILDNVCLRASDGELELAATDLDVEYRERVAVGGDGALALTVRADRLGAIANALPGDAAITLEPGEDHRVTVKSGRSRWQLPTLPVGDYPALAFGDAEAALDINVQQLARLLERVQPFQSTEETRYYLCGPLWHGEKGELALAATDGNALCRTIAKGTEWPDGAPEVILLAKGAAVMRSLADSKGLARVEWNPRMVRIALGSVTLTTKVIDGTFPDYRRVIPSSVDDPARFDPAGMLGALKRVRIASDKLSNAVTFDPGDGLLRISMRADDASTACEEIPAEPGEQPRAGFGAAYLADVLAAVGGETVELHHRDPQAPALFCRAVDDGCLVTLMPVRI